MTLTAQQWRVLINVADGQPWFDGGSGDDNWDSTRDAPVINTLCMSQGIGSSGLGLVTVVDGEYRLTDAGQRAVMLVRERAGGGT